MDRRPSMADLYAGRPGVPGVRRRSRISEGLRGASQGIGQLLALRDEKKDEDDDQDVLPSPRAALPSSPPQRRFRGSLGRTPQNQVSRRTRERRVVGKE
jgi:hypothetical protein